MPSEDELLSALATLGDVLEERGHRFGVLIAGGTTLLLLGEELRRVVDALRPGVDVAPE